MTESELAVPPTKIIIITDSPVLPTGMAETTRLIFGALLRHYPESYEICQVALKHIHAVTVPEWQLYPTKSETVGGEIRLSQNDLFGQETLTNLLNDLRPDIVFAFNDPQRIEYLCQTPTRPFKLVLYVNYDGFPVPADYYCLLKADWLITMTQFALASFLASHHAEHPENVDFIYSPADIVRFHPVEDAEKRYPSGDPHIAAG